MKRTIIYNRRVETRGRAPPCLASAGDMSIG